MPEEAPKDTENIVGSLTNLDTARMTVRWALERIRFLEQANNEMLELLRGARQSKDQTLKELEEAKQSADKRLSTIAQKERFVTEMQGMLNSLFKGEIDLKDVLEAKTKLEEHKGLIEAQAQARIQDAEAKTRKQEEDFQKRLVELEANYARSQGEAERRYQEQLQDFQRERHQESIESGAREARFKEKLLEEVQKQADQYHQKLSILQFEFSAKRQDVQKEFDELKEKLFNEARHVEMRQADSFRIAQEHWGVERKRLEEMLAQRETELAQEHAALKMTTDRLKAEQAEAIEHREKELRALESRLRQELAAEQAKREAELKHFEERIRTDSEEARAREERRVEDVTRNIEEERSRHREELGSLQATFDSRLSLAVQEQLRVREDELSKRLDAAEKQDADYQDRIARAVQQSQDRIAQVEARALAETEAARSEARKLLEEQAVRHLQELETARSHGRGFELQLEEALKAERARTLQSVEEQTRRDRQSFNTIEMELRRELASSQAEIQILKERQAKELQAALEARQKLRESFELQLHAELAVHQEANKALEQHVAAREAELRAEHEKRAAELDHEIAERSKRAELAFQDRLKGLEEDNKRMAAVRAQESEDSGKRLKALQDQFDQKLAAEMQLRTEMLQKQWALEKSTLEQKAQSEKTALEQKAQAEKNALEQRAQAEKYAFAQKIQSDRATLEMKAQEGLAAAEARWRDQVAAAQAKADSMSKQAEELVARADAAETKVAVKPSFSFPSLPPIPWKRLALVALGAATLAGGSVGGWLFTHQGANHPIPLSHPSALVWQGDTLWMSDASDQAVYELSPGKTGFTTKQRHALPGVSPVSLALGQGKLFLVDGVTGQIERRALDKDLTLLGTIASPGPKPGALYYDGASLWSVDRQTGQLFQHADDETLSVLQTYSLGPDAAALQADADGFWWAGAQSRLLTRLGPPPGLAKLEILALPELEASRKPLGGFAWKNGELWLALDGEPTVLQRPRWRLSRR